MGKNLIIPIVAAVIVGGAAFFGGMQYQKSQRSGQFTFNGQGGTRRRFGQNQNGTPNQLQGIRGNILSNNNGSLTVGLPNGSSRIVILSGSTVITQSASASAQDLQVGKPVLVLGTVNSDGSVTARDIQLNPQGRFGQTNPANP